MKKILLGSVMGLSALAISAPALAGPLTGLLYQKIDGSLDIPMNKILKKKTADQQGVKNKSFQASGGLRSTTGYQINPMVSLEASVGFNAAHKGKLNTDTSKKELSYSTLYVLTNVNVTPYTYKFSNSQSISPYIMGGIGLAHNMPAKTKINGVKAKTKPKAQNGLAWNAGVGMNWAFNKNVSADLEWNVLGIGDVYKKADKPKGFSNPISSQILVGLKYTF